MWKTILEGRDRKGLVKMADRTKAEPLLDRHVEIYESMTKRMLFNDIGTYSQSKCKKD